MLGHGRPLAAAAIAGPYGVLGPDGQIVAMMAERDGQARPQVVLAPGRVTTIRERTADMNGEPLIEE